MALNEIFVDVNKLVVEQGEVLNAVENNVGAANTDIERGVGELKEANKLQKSARWKIIAIIVGIVIIVGMIVAIIVIAVKA